MLTANRSNVRNQSKMKYDLQIGQVAGALDIMLIARLCDFSRCNVN
ncbi:protein of unknown function [Ralstonia solanacearum CMR15]|nr:protein of unknown function [Ralstonia solanacearum CMR15]